MRAGVADDLRAIFDGGTVAGLSDAQLLERFASDRAGEAGAAFAALVARHGPMVLGVCQGLLGHAHDAEDAFQATFLTLARKAATLRQPELLGPWLHRVACHTARRLRDKDARRRRHEAEAAMFREIPADHADRQEPVCSHHDEIEALHEEIERLPERYRTALVLCDLQGLTHQEAGRRLGRPAGTISARLSRARERLRVRLIRRGLALPAGVLGAAAATARASAVPRAMVDATTRVAMAFSARTMAGVVPSSIADLSRGVSRAMMFNRLMMISAAVLALGASATGVGVFAQRGGQGHLAAVAPIAAQAPQPAARPLAAEPLPDGARLRLGTSRFRPPSIVADMALSPDDATIVTIGDELIVWDTATGRERWRVRASDYGFDPPAAAYGMRAVAFAPDGSRFFTPGRQGEVVAWEASSGRREVLTIIPPDRIAQPQWGSARSIDVAPDGRRLAFGNITGVVVCDLRGKALATIANNGPIGWLKIAGQDRLAMYGGYSLGRFSPDGRILAAVTSDRPEEVRLYESETGRELRRLALAARLVRFAFSPDGKRLATTERDCGVRLYDVETTERVWSRVVPLKNPFENYTSAIAFSPDGKSLAVCATDHRIDLINSSTGDEMAHLTGHRWYPWALAFTSNGRMLYSSGWDKAIRRWDVATRTQIPPPSGVHATGVVAASPDGRTLAYEDDLGTIRLADAESGAERLTLALPGTRYSRLTFSADGRQLAGGGTGGDQVHVAVWDVTNGHLLHRWDWPKGRDPHSDVESLAFTPDGTRLAAAVHRQSAAYLWDLNVGQRTGQLAHVEVYGLSFSPDGKTLATAGWDSTVRFWEAATGNLRREVKVADQARDGGRVPAERQIGPRPKGADDDLRMFAVCYAPEGEIIATTHLDGMVRIWQADSMAMRQAFSVPNSFRDGAMSFSPDGLWLATGVAAGRVDLWDPTSGANVWDRGRHQSDVFTVGFGRDARTLVSGGVDGACYLWDLRPAGNRPGNDPARLWNDLTGQDSPAAYRAMWALAEMPDRAVAMLAGKLRSVKSVVDPDRIEPGLSRDENQSRRRMRTLLMQKDSDVVSTVAVRRALSVLTRIGTPDAIALLDDLARREPRREVGHLAAAALDRLNASKKP